MKNNVEVLDIPLFIQKKEQIKEFEKLQNYIYKNIIKSQKVKKQRKINRFKKIFTNITSIILLFTMCGMFTYMLVSKLFTFGYLRIM